MSAESGSKKILVVEDDKDIAGLVAHHLERAGYITEILNVGTDVLPRVSREPPDLVVLDLMLPELSGLEICRTIRATPSIADIPVIMLTAKSEGDRPADRSRARG